MANDIDKSMIKELKDVNLQNYIFRIPIYQRPYSWTENNVLQLLEDLFNSEDNYFVGNIVVEKKTIDGKYFLDVIDGQQRLTTLYLISSLVESSKFSKLELKYQIRKNDEKFLKKIKENKTDIKKLHSDNNASSNFLSNINEIIKFKNEKENNLSKLLEKVNLVFTFLPENTDITKYFEVMNNRGKQLEKHQILKANFLKNMIQENQKYYGTIWDVCSNMNVYIEDLLFIKVEEKKKNDFRSKLFDFYVNEDSKSLEISNINKDENNLSLEFNTILSMITSDGNKTEINTIDFKEFQSIVKFPIFLLHCLKLYFAKEEKTKSNIEEITLDDNKLIEHFKLIDKKNEAEKFINFMLRQRIIFDYFIFKRDITNKEAFFEELDLSNDKNQFKTNKKLLMIQLLLNLSAPNRTSQDWIGMALKYISTVLKKDNTCQISYENYLNQLEVFDKKMAITRLKKESLINIVNSYLKNPENNNTNEEIDNYNWNFLNTGTSVPHYWFYKLDYLLWKDEEIWKKLESSFMNFKKEEFKLSSLNSIEHIHPQSKSDSLDKIDFFGNLALISSNMNSSLIDKEYENKRTRIQEQLNNGTIESLKMILVYSKYSEWNSDNIEAHQKEMIAILKKVLNNNLDKKLST